MTNWVWGFVLTKGLAPVLTCFLQGGLGGGRNGESDSQWPL